MRRAPLILITPCTEERGSEFYDRSLSLSEPYAQAVTDAGGIPWVLPLLPSEPLLAECVTRCDGIMLSGGDDLQSGLYARRLPARVRRTLSAPDKPRDWAELVLVREAFRRRKPLLAICRGHQLLNVAFGGGLVADIGTQMRGALNHRRMDRKDRPVHRVDLAEGSRLRRVFGEGRIAVNSSHHQAVTAAAAPLRATGHSPDGVVEVMELNGSAPNALPYLLSVQFHPERLVRRDARFLELFRDFIQACAAKSL